VSATPGVADDLQSRKLKERTAACDALTHVLRDGNEVHRFYAVRALGDFATGECTADLLNCLHDPDEDVRMETVVTLGRLGAVEAVPHLMECLTQDPCADVKMLAVEALDKLDASDAIPMLRELVGGQSLDIPWSDVAADMLHDSFDLQAKAVRALGRFGDETAAAAILGMLDEEGAESFGAVATRAFAGMGDAGISSLRRCLERQAPRLRRQVADALATMEHDDAPAMLKALLRDTDAHVRRVALAAVARRTPHDHALLGLFVDADAGVRAEVVRLSGRMQPGAVMDCLRDNSAAVRQAAIITCAELTGEWRATAAQQLVSMFDSGLDDDETRDQALLVETLGRIAPDTLRVCLPRWLEAVHTDAAARAAMARILAGLGGVESVTLLSRLIDDEAHAVRVETLSALACIAESGDEVAAQHAESVFLGVLRYETENESPTPRDLPAQETGVEDFSGPSVDSTLGAHANGTPSADELLPETNDQNPGFGVAGAEQKDAFPSSTLAAILGNDAGSSTERPPEQAIEHSAVELAHLEHAFRRRERRRVSVEPQVSPLLDARRIAAQVAGNLESPAVLQALIEALAAPDLELRRGAADSIARMLERGADCSCVSLKALLAALPTRDRQLTMSLLKVLPHVPAVPARDTLIQLLEDDDAAIRAGCIQTLRAMGEDIPQLERWLSDEAPDVRCAAAVALAQRDGPSALPELVAQCFRNGGVDRVEITTILRELDMTTASNAMRAVLSDSQRRGDWRVAIEAIAVLHAAR
jgi:HEAT repeat protein